MGDKLSYTLLNIHKPSKVCYSLMLRKIIVVPGKQMSLPDIQVLGK